MTNTEISSAKFLAYALFHATMNDYDPREYLTDTINLVKKGIRREVAAYLADKFRLHFRSKKYDGAATGAEIIGALADIN